jgi:hypothetical protein
MKRSNAAKAPKTKAQKKARASDLAPKPKKGKKSRASDVAPRDEGRKGKQAPRLRPVGEPTANLPESDEDSSKRNFGLRGAAPWVARHAAKHAEELRRRNAEPPPPGSARATLRVPVGAEEIKTKVAHLHQHVGKIRSLRKRLDKNFFEVGEILIEIQNQELHVAKGYSSFEAFLDREVELPRTMALRLMRFAHTFQRDTAYDFGIDRLTAALQALDGELTNAPPSYPSSRGWSSVGLPPRPPLRFDE